MMKQRWGLDRNVLRPTPGDPWGVEQHHWNTGAKENQQLNPEWWEPSPMCSFSWMVKCSICSKPWSFIMSINICPSDWLNVEPDLLSLSDQYAYAYLVDSTLKQHNSISFSDVPRADKHSQNKKKKNNNNKKKKKKKKTTTKNKQKKTNKKKNKQKKTKKKTKNERKKNKKTKTTTKKTKQKQKNFKLTALFLEFVSGSFLIIGFSEQWQRISAAAEFK